MNARTVVLQLECQFYFLSAVISSFLLVLTLRSKTSCIYVWFIAFKFEFLL